jgi:hypothetical protein
MRAKEFISEDRQRLDEWSAERLLTEEQLLNEIGLTGLAAIGLAGWQVYDIGKGIYDVAQGKKTTEEFWADLGKDAAFMVAGAAAGGALGAIGGKLLSRAPKVYKGVKKFFTPGAKKPTPSEINRAAKEAQKKASENAKKFQQTQKVKPGQPKAKDSPAGTDGRKIPPKTSKKPTKDSAADEIIGGALGKGGGKLSKKAGAGTGKTLKNALKGAIATGAALKGAELYKGISGKFDSIVDKINKGTTSAGDVGDGVIYFGKEKNPPMKKVVGVNDPLYTKPGTDSKYTKPDTVKPKTINSKTMDSNSPVPTAKDPKLPKQDTTSLATQQGVK